MSVLWRAWGPATGARGGIWGHCPICPLAIANWPVDGQFCKRVWGPACAMYPLQGRGTVYSVLHGVPFPDTEMALEAG